MADKIQIKDGKEVPDKENFKFKYDEYKEMGRK